MRRGFIWWPTVFGCGQARVRVWLRFVTYHECYSARPCIVCRRRAERGKEPADHVCLHCEYFWDTERIVIPGKLPKATGKETSK